LKKCRGSGKGKDRLGINKEKDRLKAVSLKMEMKPFQAMHQRKGSAAKLKEIVPVE